MIVLAIESATELVGVAVADRDGPRAGVWATGRRRHGEALAPAIAHALKQAEVTLDEVGVVAVDLGPGLFTGLRVGVATAKGLAQGLGVGIMGATSLEVLARAAADAGWRGEVAAVVDARRGEVFAARYRLAHGPAGGPGDTAGVGMGPHAAAEPAIREGRSGAPGGPGSIALEEVSAPGRYVPGALAESLSAVAASGAPVLAVGDGALRYAGELSGVPGLVLAGPSLASPPPAVLAALAVERLAAGAEPEPPEAVLPTYLREADVRINWVQRRPPAAGG